MQNSIGRFATAVLFCAAAAVMLMAGATVCRAGAVPADTTAPGFGAVGDSFADEYQFYPPDRSQARNFVEILAATRGLDFGTFTATPRPSPRNQGFANDWALNGATSDDLPAQTSGLAQQIAAGSVGTAFMFIGGNDFLNAAASPNPTQALANLPQHVLTNVVTAVSTLLAASPTAHVIVANVFDLSQLPVTKQLVAAGLITQAEANAFGQVIAGYNAALATQFASNSRVALVDLNATAGAALGQKTVQVGGQTIDVQTPGDEYHHLFLADGLHVGTVGQAEIANAFVAADDSKFNTGIAPLSANEIVQFAQGVQSVAIPIPTAWASGALGLALLLVIKRRPLRTAA
jgi:hypothetical protein